MDKDSATPKTLQEAIRYFTDPVVCREFVAGIRWPDGPVCPTCESRNVRFLATRGIWECKSKHPKRQFSVKVGTIFEDSAIGLDKWLAAIWIIANAKNGVSSYEIARSLGLTQKSGWFVLHRVRLAMQTGTFTKMSGEVEADETFIGGKAIFMHKHKRAAKITGTGGTNKSAVMGLLERHGPGKPSRVKTMVIPNVRHRTLTEKVRTNVEAGSNLYTDALKSYDRLAVDYNHQVVDHAEAYVKGKVHTNGLENFWSLLKRGIKGTYVSVDPVHLFRYLDEQAFRFNERGDHDSGRFVKVLRSIIGRRLTYDDLRGASPA